MLNFLGGLLDNPGRAVGIDPETIDPRDRTAYRGMVLSALGNSIAGGTPFYQALGSIREGMDAREQAERERQQMLAQQQMQQQLQEEFGAALNGQPAPGVGGDGGAPGAQGGVSPQSLKAQALRRAAMRVAAVSPDTARKYIEMAEAIDPRPEFFAPTAVTGPDGQPMLAQFGKHGEQRAIQGFGPAAPELPTSVREFQFGQGDPSFNEWLTNQRRAGASNVNVPISVNTERSFTSTLAGLIATQVADSAEQAAAARDNLATIERIRAALPTAITGPGADARIFVARLQNALGVGGGTEQERLANTARVVQGLAQAELNAAQQMKGQGQITEGEREIIRRAAAGQITMSPPEISALLVAIEKVAQARIAAHQRNVQALGNIEGAAPLMPFFSGPDGGAAPGQSAVPSSIREAARQELLRRQQGGR